MVPAAGLPWFMTLFGRDTLITSFQELLLGPEPAAGALRALAESAGRCGRPGARRRAREDRPRDAARQDRAHLDRPLLRHRRRDAALPRPALGAVALERRRRDRARARERRAPRARLDRRLRRPRRRRLRRVPAPRDPRHRQPELEGLVQLDGLPRRLARARADRARRGAGLRLRREAAHGRARAARVATTRRRRCGSSARRRRCASASTRRSGCRNAAGTRSASTPTSGRSTRSRRTWAICSGAGSSPPSASRRSPRGSLSGPLWSGWGVRTLAADEPAFDPLEYHNGTVWPHDNSLIALGLAQAGRRTRRSASCGRCSTARRSSTTGCPSSSPATSGDRTRRRESYRPPRGRRRGPRATPLLLLRALLGLEPDPDARTLRVTADQLPAWLEGFALDGVPAFGRPWRVRVENHPAIVEFVSDRLVVGHRRPRGRAGLEPQSVFGVRICCRFTEPAAWSPASRWRRGRRRRSARGRPGTSGRSFL